MADLLKRKGISVAGFCDSNKREQDIIVGNKQYSIYPIGVISKNKEQYSVIITIADYNEIKKIERRLKNLRIEVCTVKQILEVSEEDAIARNRKYIADFHTDEMENYYQGGESEEALQVFWGAGSEFRKMFSLLDISNVVELACGHGRHVPYYLDNSDPNYVSGYFGQKYCLL